MPARKSRESAFLRPKASVDRLRDRAPRREPGDRSGAHPRFIGEAWAWAASPNWIDDSLARNALWRRVFVSMSGP